MLGEIMALGCALTWAVSVLLFKASELGGGVRPQQLNVFKNVLALGLLLATMAATGTSFATERAAWDWVALAASGVLGIAVGDTLYFVALRRIGPGLLAIVQTAYAPLVVLLSAGILGERPGLAFFVGAVFVIGGVLLATPAAPTPASVGPATDQGGVAVGVVAAALMALGIVIAKPALERSGLVEATTVRLAAGVAAQAVWIAQRPGARATLRIFRPSRVWTRLVPGSVMGAYVSMLLWLGGMKYTDASIAAVLNQLAVVFTLVGGWLVFGERLGRARVAGAILAMAGAAVIVAGG